MTPDPHHFVVPVPRNDLLFAPRQPGAAPSAAEYELIDRCVQVQAVTWCTAKGPACRFCMGIMGLEP